MRRRPLFTLVATLAVVRGVQGAQYSIINLGSLGGGGTRGMSINESGQVGGESYVPPSGPVHAFATSGVINPATDDKGTNGATASYGRGINDSGQLAGYTFGSAGPTPVERAFRADPGTAMVDLGTLGGANSNAQAINNAGQVAGYSDTGGASSKTHAFRTAANNPINPLTDDLGALDGGTSFGYAINASGQVVGRSTSGGGVTHAFRTTASGVIDAGADLGTLFGFTTYSLGVNDAGGAVGIGFAGPNFSSAYHAFYVPAGRALLPTDDLGTLPGGLLSGALGINGSNVIVGSGSTGGVGSPFHAIVWYGPGTTAIDLNTLIPAGSGWELLAAQSINDAGQITGYGYFNGNTSTYAGFVLTVAVPEPASMGLLTLGLPLLVRRRR